MRNAKLLAALGLVSMGAGTGVASADAPKLSEVLDASGITMTGYVAASYFHSSETNTYHNFDIGHDTFQLDQAGLTVAYQPKEGFGALVNVIGGEDARLQNTYEGNNPDGLEVLQAYAQYATGGLTLIAGKFVTLAGAEVIAPTGNTNFSRSLLFAFEPAVHTGVRATYALNDMVTLYGGVNNGWNYTHTNYGSKTGEVGVGVTPSKMFSIAAYGYFGKDPTFDAPRKFIDVVATINATDALSFVLSYDWGQQEGASALTVSGTDKAKWNGYAAYANYKFSDQWRISVRAEVLDDKEGLFTGAEQKLKEGTVTLGYAPVENFEVRLEGRYDKAPETTIPKFNSAAFEDNQKEFAIQGVFKF